MNIPQRERSRIKRNLLIACSVALVCGIILAVLEKNGVINLYDQQKTNEPTQEQKTEQSKTDASQKEAFLNAESNSSSDKSTANTDAAVPAATPTSADSITLSAQQQGSNVVTTIKLSDQGFASGSCKLTATANGRSTVQSADIIYQPEYSTCAGFAVPISTIGSGTWDIKLEVMPTGGSLLTKSATVTVK